MPLFCRVLKGIIHRSIGHQKCFTRTLSTPSSLKQVTSVQTSLPNEQVELLQMPDPILFHDFFEVRKLFTVKDLFDARVHYGHTMGTLNEHMKQFIIGKRMETLIFDLEQTAELLSDALNFIAHIAFRGGIILFVARCKQNTLMIENTAKECKEYCYTRDWHKGTFTDPNYFGHMTRLPDLTIFLNILDSVFDIHNAVIESNKLLIPSVGIVDTNCFPNYITYPIPGNDDSPEAIALYCKLFKEAILRGKAKRKEFQEKYKHIIEDS